MSKRYLKQVRDWNIRAHSCIHNNCGCRTFYVIITSDIFEKLKTGKEEKFRIMLICQKCGEPEMYGFEPISSLASLFR